MGKGPTQLLISFEDAVVKDLGAHLFEYTERDSILYNLGLGCKWDEPRYVYENDSQFGVLPTYPVIPPFHGVLSELPLQDILPNFNPMMLLHGEQYLELKGPLPSAGRLKTVPRIIDIKDKGKAGVITIGAAIYNADTGALLAEQEITSFVRGAGGFGPTPTVTRVPAAIAANEPPGRAPDAVVQEKTSEDLAAIYRLSGDYNPLHIDPEFAAVGGFDKPILHGLCTYGIATKHVMKQFGAGDPYSIKSVKARMAKHVFPGETLQTEMWKVSPSVVIFRVRVLERDVLALTNAAVELNVATSKL
eukprot:jgi/Botrbrau1/23599/Bobra.0141s0062.1